MDNGNLKFGLLAMVFAVWLGVTVGLLGHG
jgi:hypothetical protein